MCFRLAAGQPGALTQSLGPRNCYATNFRAVKSGPCLLAAVRLVHWRFLNPSFQRGAVAPQQLLVLCRISLGRGDVESVRAGEAGG